MFKFTQSHVSLSKLDQQTVPATAKLLSHSCLSDWLHNYRCLLTGGAGIPSQSQVDSCLVGMAWWGRQVTFLTSITTLNLIHCLTGSWWSLICHVIWCSDSDNAVVCAEPTVHCNRSGTVCHIHRLMSFANVWTHALWLVVDRAYEPCSDVFLVSTELFRKL